MNLGVGQGLGETSDGRESRGTLGRALRQEPTALPPQPHSLALCVQTLSLPHSTGLSSCASAHFNLSIKPQVEAIIPISSY